MLHQALAGDARALQSALRREEELERASDRGYWKPLKAELESLRRTVGSLGKLKRPAPASFLPDIKQQIYRRSRGRFFGSRWKLFGRIPFEWVSLATIIAMLVYYLAMLHGSPGGVKPAP